MSHTLVLPVILPLLAAIALLAAHRSAVTTARAIALASALGQLAVAAHLVVLAADGQIRVHALGGWPAPYGIVLVLDRMAAVMLALNAALALAVLVYSTGGTDGAGRHFHVLVQLVLMGLNGAFLTGDVFNLFVFFEVLLLASYGLLMHGGGLARARAGLAYVVLNLAGSALFLVALGVLYGALGTLNVADISIVLPHVPVESQALVRTAAILLYVVFVLKAALLPLGFWLPHAYAAASVPVAALFAIMTKVGVYALLRVSTSGFSAAPFTADLLDAWLPGLALATIALGALGAIAATHLGVVVANLIVISTGTLLAALGAREAAVDAALVYYLVHSTLVAAGLFLVAGAVAAGGDDTPHALSRPHRPSPAVLGLAFLVLAVAASGVPPLSGFLGKVMLMRSLQDTSFGAAIWVALLSSGFVVALALARAASTIFWEGSIATGAAWAAIGSRARASLAALAVASPALALLAPPVASYARAAADQLHDRAAYAAAVLGDRTAIEREKRP
jgi:multicomponent K+:H+ antiporter subunit D